MASFLENLRASFADATAQTASNEANVFTSRRSPKEIVNTIDFAGEEDKPGKSIMYTPFVWKKGRDGEKQRGLLVHDGKKIYGLEREDGVSMNAKAVQRMMNDLANDDESSFSDIQGVNSYSFIDSDKKPTGSSEMMDYNLYGRQAERLGRGTDSNFLRALRKAATR